MQTNSLIYRLAASVLLVGALGCGSSTTEKLVPGTTAAPVSTGAEATPNGAPNGQTPVTAEPAVASTANNLPGPPEIAVAAPTNATAPATTAAAPVTAAPTTNLPITIAPTAAPGVPPKPHEEPLESRDYSSLMFVFMLATFIGLGVILRVSRLLHTPLMSLTNAISAIAVVGSILVVGDGNNPWGIRLMGAVALFASMTNIVSGFLITDRMLKMFKSPSGGGKP